MKSWQWDKGYENIVEMFLPPQWNNVDTRFDDLATACRIWSNCKEFNLIKSDITRLRKLRNKHLGHNPDLKVTCNDKTAIFDALESILNSNAVQGYINAPKCKRELDAIAQGDELMQSIHELRNDIKNLTRRRHWYKQYSLHAVIFAVIILFLSLCTFVKYPQYEGCISEEYSHPFLQDMPLLPYLKEHTALVGREWLFEKIQRKIFISNSNQKGILITADMGYGKSAVIRHLLCSKEGDKGHSITQHTIAFHICKFDVPSTKSPQRFVHRLIGFFATKIPEFGAIIAMLPDHALIYDHMSCSKNIIACFDQGFLHPLQELTNTPADPIFIIIDAFDECFIDKAKENALYQLIHARYRKMPKWIKFIITSRNTTLFHRLDRLDTFHLNFMDQRNVNDVKKYLEYKVLLSPHLQNITEGVDKLLDQSEGSFLFVVHLIDFILTHKTANLYKLPSTLSDVYEMHFERHFHSDEDFGNAKNILELVLATLHPLTVHEVKYILIHSNLTQENTFHEDFESIKFCFRSNYELTLVHQSLQFWLTSAENIRYGVSTANGHAMLSQFLLKQLGNDHTHDIADVVIHVAESKRSGLVKAFETSIALFNITKSSLHRLIWNSNSTLALELILKMDVDVDSLNEGNVTPAFVASARGHLNQLKYLESMGADLNFKTNSSYLITSMKHIEIIKREYFFGYGLIHIATQFGHISIVKHLMNHNMSTCNTMNGLGLTAVEIACENGHITILKLMTKSNFSIGNCIYYASKNRHAHIIRYLAEVRVNVSCISRQASVNAFKKITSIYNSKTIVSFGSGYSNVLYEMYDIWWVVHQESALHAAINARGFETAEVLISKYPHLAECVDASGITPFLLSVALNETKPFHLLIDRVSRDKCSNSSLDHKQANMKERLCPTGATFIHLDAIYGRLNMTKVVLNRGMDINWFSADANSVTPLHYAACTGNIHILFYAGNSLLNSIANLRTINGSSPYHSAAICGSLESFFVMIDKFNDNIPSLKDNYNRTILHYLVLRKFINQTASDDKILQEQNSVGFNNIVNLLSMSVSELDSYKRNVIHYALYNGHFTFLMYFSDHYSNLLRNMLEQQDINGVNPLRYAVVDQKSNENIDLMLSSSCVFYDIFYHRRESWNGFYNRLSSWEMGLLHIIFFLKPDLHMHFLPIFKDLVIKSPYLTTAVLVYMDRPALVAIKRNFIEALGEYPSAYSVLALAKHRPKLFTSCGEPLSESLLHLMAYKYHVSAMYILQFYHLVFGNPVDVKALSCADSAGYNTFHYALLGSNIGVAIRLFDTGIRIANARVSLKNIPWMILFGRAKFCFSYNNECSDQMSCMDILLHKFFYKFGAKFKYSDICNEKHVRLSLVHVIAASGLRYTLRLLTDLYGIGVIECKNLDGISPLYLGDLMNSQGWRDTLTVSDLSLPRFATEEVLLGFLLNDFPVRLHIYKCISSSRSYSKYSTQMFFSCVYKSRHNTNKIFIGNCVLVTLTYIDISQTEILAEFQSAIKSKSKSEIPVLLEDVVYVARHFDNILGQFEVTHNYLGLKQMIISWNDKKPISCALNVKEFDNAIPCFKLYIELDHMLRKVVTLLKSIWLQRLLRPCDSKLSTISEEFSFMKRRVDYRNKFQNILRLIKHPVTITKLDKLILEHRYLHVLEKTVNYQYMKARLYTTINTMSVAAKSRTMVYVQDVKKPLDGMKIRSKYTPFKP